MALGSNIYNNNENKTNYSDEVFSPYKMGNALSEIDKTRLSFSFWNRMLKITICPLLGVENNIPKWDINNKVEIYLNHTKALLLAQSIQNVLDGKSNNEGVPSSSKSIIFSNGLEFGSDNYFLTIRDIDPNTGSIITSIAYEFKKNYHYTVSNFNESNLDFNKNYNDTIEIVELQNLLTEYYKEASCAGAYFALETFKYNNSKTQTKLNSICEKLGIEYSSKANTSTKGSFFNNNNGNVNNNNFSIASPDDIENEIG